MKTVEKTENEIFEKLPTKFRSQGDCRVLARTDDYVILERIPQNSSKTAFEVHAIAKNKAWEIEGRVVPAKESIQPPSQFGCKAWTSITKEAAFERYNKLISTPKK